MAIQQRGENFGELVALMQRLLQPDGCPWDREQTLTTLKPFLIEEAYEVLEAIEVGDIAEHREELGDLLFQIVFQAELRAAEGSFGINDVVRAIVDKMTHRHPHVFGDTQVSGTQEVLANWGKLKEKEQAQKGRPRRSLEGVPVDLPALLRAQRIGEKAAAVGFDWPDVQGVRDKVDEELRELDEAMARGTPSEIEHELGDLLFAISRLAAKVGIEPESALRTAVRRFCGRFEQLEDQVIAGGHAVKDLPLAELDRIWTEVKRQVPKK